MHAFKQAAAVVVSAIVATASSAALAQSTNIDTSVTAAPNNGASNNNISVQVQPYRPHAEDACYVSKKKHYLTSQFPFVETYYTRTKDAACVNEIEVPVYMACIGAENFGECADKVSQERYGMPFQRRYTTITIPTDTSNTDGNVNINNTVYRSAAAAVPVTKSDKCLPGVGISLSVVSVSGMDTSSLDQRCNSLKNPEQKPAPNSP